MAKEPRKDAKYSEAVKEVIGKFKDEYRKQPTRELRGIIMKEKILPAIFNFWKGPDQPRMEEQDSKARQKV